MNIGILQQKCLWDILYVDIMIMFMNHIRIFPECKVDYSKKFIYNILYIPRYNKGMASYPDYRGMM